VFPFYTLIFVQMPPTNRWPSAPSGIHHGWLPNSREKLDSHEEDEAAGIIG
jgi:hypothetical protein